MKNITPRFYGLLFTLLLLGGTLSSFSALPDAKTAEQPPVEKKITTQEQRRQQRLNKRYNRLHQRMEQTTHTKKRHRLQQKIRQVEQQQAGNPSLTYGILAFITAILGLLVGALSFILLIFGGLPAVAIAAFLLLAVSITFAIIALLRSKNSTEKPFKGLAIAALIIAGVVLLVFVVTHLISLL